MDLVVYGHYGSQSACAKARYRLDSEHHIIRRMLFIRQSEFLVQSLEYKRAFSYMTRRTVTHFDDVLSLLIERKVLIKRGNGIRFRFRDPYTFCDICQYLRRDITVNRLDITSENMTAAYSRIVDVDMAEEMVAYSTNQVLTQAGTSMLAQANERPSQVLQLLQ